MLICDKMFVGCIYVQNTMVRFRLLQVIDIGHFESHLRKAANTRSLLDLRTSDQSNNEEALV